MPASQSEVLVGRRYLERGFLDAAMKLFVRNTELVTAGDWTGLADRLMERNRINDAVRICELGSVPLPVVTARINRFIAEQGKGPYPDME